MLHISKRALFKFSRKCAISETVTSSPLLTCLRRANYCAEPKPPKIALVYGGGGALGSKTIVEFKKRGWKTIAVDLNTTAAADHSYIARPDTLAKDIQNLQASLTDNKVTLDAVVCTAGGWTSGTLQDIAVLEQVPRMHEMNVMPGVASALIASHYLRQGGLLVLTGAASALKVDTSNVAYSLAKNAVHLLTASAAQSMPNCHVIAITPRMLDTPANRNAMSGADYSSWTPLQHVTTKLIEWAEGKDQVPKSGSLVECITRDGITTWTVHS